MEARRTNPNAPTWDVYQHGFYTGTTKYVYDQRPFSLGDLQKRPTNLGDILSLPKSNQPRNWPGIAVEQAQQAALIGKKVAMGDVTELTNELGKPLTKEELKDYQESIQTYGKTAFEESQKKSMILGYSILAGLPQEVGKENPMALGGNIVLGVTRGVVGLGVGVQMPFYEGFKAVVGTPGGKISKGLAGGLAFGGTIGGGLISTGAQLAYLGGRPFARGKGPVGARVIKGLVTWPSKFSGADVVSAVSLGTQFAVGGAIAGKVFPAKGAIPASTTKAFKLAEQVRKAQKPAPPFTAEWPGIIQEAPKVGPGPLGKPLSVTAQEFGYGKSFSEVQKRFEVSREQPINVVLKDLQRLVAPNLKAAETKYAQRIAKGKNPLTFDLAPRGTRPVTFESITTPLKGKKTVEVIQPTEYLFPGFEMFSIRFGRTVTEQVERTKAIPKSTGIREVFNFEKLGRVSKIRDFGFNVGRAASVGAFVGIGQTANIKMGAGQAQAPSFLFGLGSKQRQHQSLFNPPTTKQVPASKTTINEAFSFAGTLSTTTEATKAITTGLVIMGGLGFGAPSLGSKFWEYKPLKNPQLGGGGGEDLIYGSNRKAPKSKYKPSILGTFLPKGFKRNKKATLTGFEIRPMR